MRNPYDLINGLVVAVNARDEEMLASCFAEQAVVQDGGLEYHGALGVRRWIQDAFDKYGLKLKVLEVSGEGDKWLFDAVVSGTFEGSPVQLEHSVVIRDGKIANLCI